MANVTSGHSVFDQASDRFTDKTVYSPVDGTKPSVKDRFRIGRSSTPDPQPYTTYFRDDERCDRWNKLEYTTGAR